MLICLQHAKSCPALRMASGMEKGAGAEISARSAGLHFFQS